MMIDPLRDTHLYCKALDIAWSHGYDIVTEDFMLFAAMSSLSKAIDKAFFECNLTYESVSKRVQQNIKSDKIGLLEFGEDIQESENFTRSIDEFNELIEKNNTVALTDENILIFLLSRTYLPFKELDHIGVNKGTLLTKLKFRVTEASKVTDTKSESLIDKFCRDISLSAKLGQVDPLVGREKELLRLIQILGRRKKNNPAILGEAGVGKTALVEGLAQLIHDEDPLVEALHGKRIVELDLPLMVAGTKYRGEFEERFTAIIKELESNPDIIVFVDEMHSIMGAGSCEGSVGDAATMLKPSLARGRIRMIGATTKDEYNIIKKDPAMERRFQPVELLELTDKEIFAILKGSKHKYEEFHGVEYPDSILKKIVQLGKKFDKRHAPDIQLDLLDELGSRFKGHKVGKKELDQVFEDQMQSSQTKIKTVGF